MHILATTTNDALSIVETAILKKAPSSIPSCLDLVDQPTSSTWSPDNHYLYISSLHTIHRYDSTQNTLEHLYRHDGPEISQVISRDSNTVIFGSGNTIHILECESSTARISQTFTSHQNSITSLSLSNDHTLLASTSATAVQVHVLSSGACTTIRGLGGQDVTTCAFHPHLRTRLLVASSKRLMVYDTTKPSSPLKTIVMNDPAAGDIFAVASSPFSKTLVAVACSNGYVGLIDLEKEKALFRTLNLKATLTTLEFSPEGANIYFGTESGKILILDLRALDKLPKAVVASTHGSPIRTISVQKKIIDRTVKTPASNAGATREPSTNTLPSTRRTISTAAAQTSRSASKTAPSPARARAAVLVSPANRKASFAKGAILGTPSRRPLERDNKQVLSPVRDPLGNIISENITDPLDVLAARRRRGQVDSKPHVDSSRTRAVPSPRKATTTSSAKMPIKINDNENPRRTRTLPTSSSASIVPSRRPSTTSIATSVSAGEHLTSNSDAPRSSPQHRRQRTVSSVSRAGSEAISAISSNSKSTRVTTTTSTSRPSSSASRPGSSLTSATTQHTSPLHTDHKMVPSLHLTGTSRTPSPDFAGPHGPDPVTPIPVSKQGKKKSMGVLGMGTPEVNRWIDAGKNDAEKEDVKGKGKSKIVGFQDDHELDDDSEHDDDVLQERERNLSLQISPQRPHTRIASSSGGLRDQSSSTRTASLNLPAELSSGNLGTSNGLGGPSSAHELLRTIVQDVMFDFQRENKAEMMGLHLDLLRMGRSWKTELRQLMDEYVGDLKDLREENQRLRWENERLRRGF